MTTLDTTDELCYVLPMKIIGDDIDWQIPLSRYQYVTNGVELMQVVGMVAYNDGNPIYMIRNQYGIDSPMSHGDLMNFATKIIS